MSYNSLRDWDDLCCVLILSHPFDGRLITSFMMLCVLMGMFVGLRHGERSQQRQEES